MNEAASILSNCFDVPAGERIRDQHFEVSINQARRYWPGSVRKCRSNSDKCPRSPVRHRPSAYKRPLSFSCACTSIMICSGARLATPLFRAFSSNIAQFSFGRFALFILMDQRIDIGLCISALRFKPGSGLFIQRYRHFAHARTLFRDRDYARKRAGRQRPKTTSDRPARMV